jgi:hypothetical protein
MSVPKTPPTYAIWVGLEIGQMIPVNIVAIAVVKGGPSAGVSGPRNYYQHNESLDVSN